MIRQETIYIRKYLGEYDDESGNPYKKYGEVIALESSLNSVSGSYEAIVYGDRTKRMVQTYIDYDTYIGVFNEGDLVYLYGADDKNEKYIGSNANYQINSVLPQNMKIKIIMEQRP